MEESLCSWAHIGVFGPQHEASGRAALQRGRVFSGLRMSLGAGRAHQALEFANLYPRGPFPSGRLGGGRGCGCSCPPSTLPGPCGQSGFVEVQAAATRAARPPSGPRPRGSLTQGPRSTGREAGPGHAGALPPDAPHTRPGPPSPHTAGARPGSGGAGTAHRARPGHPGLGRFDDRVPTCVSACLCCCCRCRRLTPGPLGPPENQPAPPHRSPPPRSHGPLVLKPLGEHGVGCCGQGPATRHLCP